MSNGYRSSLDTSVVANYLYVCLPGNIERDRGAASVIDSSDCYTAIGGKAKQEFDALCERRYALYQDIVDYVTTTGEEIFDYEPRERDIHTSQHDRTHLRHNVQMSWYDIDKREQLSILRRCFQDIQLYRDSIVNEKIDDTFPKQRNDRLLDKLNENIDIGHDCEIIVDAVELSTSHSINTLVAIDSDITSGNHRNTIYSTIEDVTGVPDLLEIAAPNDLSL